MGHGGDIPAGGCGGWVKNEADAISSVELTSACVEVRRQLARVVLSFPCVGSQG